MERFTLNRAGTFTADRATVNQCKGSGHSDYDYFVKVTCGTHLDSQGFVIDHVLVDKAVQRAVRRISSCEKLCLQIEEEVKKVLLEHKCEIHNIYVKITPRAAPSRQYAFMEFEKSYEKKPEGDLAWLSGL